MTSTPPTSRTSGPTAPPPPGPTAPRPADPGPLDAVAGSLKLKLGVLVAVSVLAAALVAEIGDRAGLPAWLTLPVTVAAALAVTQWLARGMTSPLREMTVAAARMADGHHDVRVAATGDDEVGRLARAFNAMASALASTDRERRELVATVSHELRTPLTAQRALLENLADGVVRPDDAALGAALRQAERLSDLVTDLLDLSRLDAGVSALRLGDVQVASLVADVVAETSGPGTTAAEREVSFVVDVRPEDLQVRADADRIAQVVVNLLDNAARHSPVGGEVRLAVRRDDSTWILDVSDDGPGLPADVGDRVFDRFGTGAERSGTGGTGLGLAISRWACELHGGSLASVPTDGQGARLRMRLPLRPAAQRPTPVVGGAAGAAPSRTSTAARPVEATVGAPSAAAPPRDDLERWWPERDLAPQPRLLLASAAVGVLGSVALVDQRVGLGALLVSLAIAATVVGASGRRRAPWTVAVVVLGVALASATVVRAAEWIGVVGVLAAGTLLATAVTGARSLPALPLSVAAWIASAARGLPLLNRTLSATSQSPVLWPALRTAGLAAAGLVLFGGLFASGDAIFGSWAEAIVPDLAWDSVVARGFVWFFITGVTLTGCYVALNPPPVLAEDLPDGRPVRHAWEWLVPVGTVVGLFAAFLLAQSTALFGGHDYLRRTTGLTYAEYVHQGFGQLTVATALTLAVIAWALRKAPRTTVRERVVLRSVLGAQCALTLAVVASALYRMSLYQDAYGFTVLRLYVDAFELWLGLVVVLVLVAVVRLRPTGGSAWLPRAAVASGAVMMLGLAVLNPDGWVASHNAERYAETGRLDVEYLAGLSDDAWPAIVDDLPRDVAACVLERADRLDTDDDGFWAWNLGRERGADARDRLAGVAPAATCDTIPRE